MIYVQADYKHVGGKANDDDNEGDDDVDCNVSDGDNEDGDDVKITLLEITITILVSVQVVRYDGRLLLIDRQTRSDVYVTLTQDHS